MSGIWILGAGGHAKVAIATAEAGGLVVEGLFDDDPAKNGSAVLGVGVSAPTAPVEWWRETERAAFIAIGANKVRQRFATMLPARWTALVHPAAWVHASSDIDDGALICAGAIVQPDAFVGAHAIVNTGTVVEHDCRVGAYVHIASMACLAGAAQVGEGSFIGAGAVILPGIKVGQWATVGAGAVVTKDVPDGATVAGVPARQGA